MQNISKFVIVILFIILMGALFYYSKNRPVVENNPAVTQEERGDTFLEDEHAYQGDSRISATESAIVQMWQSTDDVKFRREFKVDYSVTDTYDGDAEATNSGTWSLFTKENTDKDFKGTYESGVVYMKIKTSEDTFFYKVLKVTPEELEMIYLDRGNILRFTKVQ